MAYSPFDYMPPSYAVAGDDEEERKRREAEEAAKAAGPVEPGPVKQTITYDPVTGEQRMKIEGSVDDLSPKNALTPTVSMPGQMPEPTPVAEEPVKPAVPELTRSFEPTAQPQPQPEPAPQQQTQLPPGVKMVNGKLQLAPTEPTAPAMPQQAPAMPPMPQPGPGVQVAGPAQMPPQAAPAPEKPAFGEMWSQAGQDPTKFLAMRNDTSLTPEQRKLAGREASRLALMEGDRGEQEAAVKQKMQDAVASGNFNELAKMMKTKNEEGSWGRRILYGMLGMEAAVKDEEAKLGIGAKWNSTTVTDDKGNTRNVLVKTRADGLPVEGYDATTGAKLDEKTLAGVPTGTQKLNIVGGTYVNDKTGEVGRVVSDEKTGISYIQTDSGRKPMAGFRPQASSGTLDMQRVSQIQRQNIDLAGDWAKLQMKVQGAAPEAANRYLGEFNAKHRTNYGLSQLSGSAPQISLETGQMVEAPAPAQAAAATPPAQAAAATPPKPAAATPPAVTTTPAAAPTQTVPQKTGGSGVSTGGAVSPAMLEQQMALSKKAAEEKIETGAVVEREKLKPGAKAEGEQVATDVKNQGFADRTYDLMQQINKEIVKSTGSSIGAGVDTVAAAIGKSTEGSKAISRLNVLSYNILANIPRFEGPQSDIDVQMYKQAAGDFNNRKLPVEDRLAALDALRTILQRYDKAGKNDWTFGAGGQGGGAGSGTTSSGNKYKRVQ